MYSLRAISVTAPTSQQVADFKAYIGQSGSAADTMVAEALTEAMVNVGEWHDRSLLGATYRLEVTEREGTGAVRLYCTPKNVISVTDGAGASVPYQHAENGRYVTVRSASDSLVITYTTQVDTGASVSLTQKVWEYGKARYEGRFMDAAQILMR